MQNIRYLTTADIPVIVESFAQINWDKPATTFEKYLHEQQSGKRVVWVAHVDGKFAGYVTLVWRSKYQPFHEKNIPEIKDLNVLPHFHNLGIGTKLLETAESLAATKSEVIGIGVGLHEGYGNAQKLYVKRGYIPDGKGVTHFYKPVSPGSHTILDDEFVLWLTKALK